MTINLSKFGNAVHSTVNAIPLKSHIHLGITRLMNSGNAVFNWLPGNERLWEHLAKLPWEVQYKFGLELLKYSIKYDGNTSGFVKIAKQVLDTASK